MVKLRAGDVVTFRAKVLSTAPLDGGQQIMAQILPRGETVGWCIPSENQFTPVEQPIAEKDIVRFKNDIDGKHFDVLTIYPDGQITVRKVGEKLIQLTSINSVERI